MLYSEKLRGFAAAHPCKTLTVDGAVVPLHPQRKGIGPDAGAF